MWYGTMRGGWRQDPTTSRRTRRCRLGRNTDASGPIYSGCSAVARVVGLICVSGLHKEQAQLSFAARGAHTSAEPKVCTWLYLDVIPRLDAYFVFRGRSQTPVVGQRTLRPVGSYTLSERQDPVQSW